MIPKDLEGIASSVIAQTMVHAVQVWQSAKNGKLTSVKTQNWFFNIARINIAGCHSSLLLVLATRSLFQYNNFK